MINYGWRPEYLDALNDPIAAPSGRLLRSRPVQSVKSERRRDDRRDHDPGDEDRS